MNLKEEDREILRHLSLEDRHAFSFRMGLYFAYTLFEVDCPEDQFEELSRQLGPKWGDQIKRALAEDQPASPPRPAAAKERTGFFGLRRSK